MDKKQFSRDEFRLLERRFSLIATGRKEFHFHPSSNKKCIEFYAYSLCKTDKETRSRLGLEGLYEIELNHHFGHDDGIYGRIYKVAPRKERGFSNQRMESKMDFINLTPHTVKVVSKDGQSIIASFLSSGVARLVENRSNVRDHGGVPVSVGTFGEPENLPAPEENTMLIVSQLLFDALPERTDLCFPAGVVRDDEGNIIGCTSLGVRR